MTAALSRYGMYYDDVEQDIYYYDDLVEEADLASVSEWLSDESLAVVEQLLQDPDKVQLEELAPVLKELKQEAKNYSHDLEALLIDMIDDGCFSEEDWQEMSDYFETYRGLVNISGDSISELYQLKENDKRSLTDSEIQLLEDSLDILLHIGDGLYDSFELIPETSL